MKLRGKGRVLVAVAALAALLSAGAAGMTQLNAGHTTQSTPTEGGGSIGGK